MSHTEPPPRFLESIREAAAMLTELARQEAAAIAELERLAAAQIAERIRTDPEFVPDDWLIACPPQLWADSDTLVVSVGPHPAPPAQSGGTEPQSGPQDTLVTLDIVHSPVCPPLTVLLIRSPEWFSRQLQSEPLRFEPTPPDQFRSLYWDLVWGPHRPPVIPPPDHRSIGGIY